MAKKKSQKGKQEFVNRDAVKKLWNAVPVGEWFQLLQEIAPANRWEQKGHTQIVGCCPYHPDEKPSFSLSFHKCMGKCFGATCEKVVVDLVSLVAKLRNCSYTESLLFLNDRFNLGDKLQANTDELNKYNNIQELKKQAAIASNKVLMEVLRDNPEHLAYCRPAATYLVDVRKLPADTLSNLPVGVFGKPEHMKKYIPETLHPLYEEYFAKCKSVKHWGSIMFYYNDSPGSITRFKLRFRDGAVENPMPSQESIDALDDDARSKLFAKEFEYIEDPYATGTLGVFGLFKYQRMVGKNDTNAYITEGEFDALSYMAAQDKHGSTHFMIMSTGGKGSTDIGFLRDFGIRTCWMIQDHPVKNGDDWVLTFLGNSKNFTSSANKFPMDFKIFMWPVEVQGYDLDEAVRLNSYEMLVECLYRQRNVNFLNSVPWVVLKCDRELDACKRDFDGQLAQVDVIEDAVTQKTNILDDRKKKIQEILLRWIRYLQDPTDMLAFTQKYAASENIDISAASEIEKKYKGLDSVEGNVEVLEKALEKELAITHYEIKSNKHAVFAYSKARRETFELQLTDKQRDTQLSLYLGMDIDKWIEQQLGDSPILHEGTGQKGPGVADMLRSKNGKRILDRAFNSLVHKASNIKDLRRLGQGIHHGILPSRLKKQQIVYFVNGKDLFEGIFQDTGKVEWKQLDSNVDNGIIFFDLNTDSQWSTTVSQVDDLCEASNVNLKDVHNKVMTILDAWLFEHDHVVKSFLAVYIMSLTVMCAVGDVNILIIGGSKESGKTSFLTLLSGNESKGPDCVPTLLESGKQLFNATEAAVYQNFNWSSRLLIVDEAEQSPSHKTKHDDRVKELIRMLYGLPMGEGIHVNRGGVTADQKVEYRLIMPAVLAAINIPTDDVFLTRSFVVNTVKEPGRQNATDYIYDRFSEEQLLELRKAVTIGLIPKIPELIRKRAELRKRLFGLGHDIVKESNRFLNSLLTPLAVYDLLGFDSGELYRNILKVNKHRLEAFHRQDQQNKLLNSCLYREKVKIANESSYPEFVSAKSLILSYQYNALNSSDCGVYYLEDKDWIIFLWRQLKHTVLQRTDYERMEENALQMQAAKCDFAYMEVTPEEHDHIVAMLNLKDVKGPQDYSVLGKGYLTNNHATKEVGLSTEEKKGCSNVVPLEKKIVGMGFSI